MSTATQKKLRQDIKRASKVIGVGEKELAERAMRFYLASVEQEIALQNELEAWEQISDTTLHAMEKALS